MLYRQGDEIGGFYYLKAGKIIISILRKDGYERIIDFVYPESLLGEQMVNDEPAFTTAKAQVDSTLYFFSEYKFKELCEAHPEAASEFGISLIRKIRLFANINLVLNAPIDVQLAFFLLNLAEKKASNTIEVNQTSLANYIGKSRVAVWKVLKEWKEEDIIEINKRSIIIKNIERLKRKMNDH